MKRALLITVAVLGAASCGPAGTTLTIHNIGERQRITAVGLAPCGTTVEGGFSPATIMQPVDISPGESETVPLTPGCSDVTAITENYDYVQAKVVSEPDQDLTWRLNP